METRNQWHSWLQRHHAIESEAWLICFKKHTGIPGISYEDAIEEALCFGWIDSIIQKLDEDRYARRFTPRKPNSVWSHLNKQRALKMIRCGAMQEPGRKTLPADVLKGSITPRNTPGKRFLIPALIRRGLESHPEAATSFESLSPSLKRQYVGWVISAKKEETRARRLGELLSILAANRRLGMK